MIDVCPINTKGEPHGHWRFMINPKMIAYEGNYINGKQSGLWISYSHDEDNSIILKKYIIK